MRNTVYSWRWNSVKLMTYIDLISEHIVTNCVSEWFWMYQNCTQASRHAHIRTRTITHYSNIFRHIQTTDDCEHEWTMTILPWTMVERHMVRICSNLFESHWRSILLPFHFHVETRWNPVHMVHGVCQTETYRNTNEFRSRLDHRLETVLVCIGCGWILRNSFLFLANRKNQKPCEAVNHHAVKRC